MLWGSWKHLNCVLSYQNQGLSKKFISSGDRSMTSSEFRVWVWIWYRCNGDTVCAAGRAGNIVNVCEYTGKAALRVYIGIEWLVSQQGKVKGNTLPSHIFNCWGFGKKTSTTAVRVSMTHAEVTRTVLDKNLWERHMQPQQFVKNHSWLTEFQ